MRWANSPPTSGTPLIGRAADLAAASELLHVARLVTLTGPPGVGKTRLAVDLAGQAAAARGGAVAWIDLSPLRDPHLVLPEIARVIDTAPDPDVLLVLDSCEHLLATASELGELLRTTTRLRLLATSRERLRLGAEVEYPVRPLPLPDTGDIENWPALAANPCIALLLARAPATVTLSARTARGLVDICVGLDGVPLALELAAPRLRIFTPIELASRLACRTTSLAGGARDAPPRHRDLRAAIGWSHDLLSERDRAVFRRLSVFASAWTVEAADAVCVEPELLDALESLVDKSLVQCIPPQDDPGEQDARFAMLNSLREFAGDQLEAAEGSAARDRHAAYFAAQARHWEATLGNIEEIATWMSYRRIRADLRVAFEHSRGGPHPDVTLWLSTAVGWRAYSRGELALASVLLEAIDQAVADDRCAPDACAAALLVAGVITFGQRRSTQAQRYFTAAMDCTNEGASPRRRAIAFAFLGHLARDRAEYETAQARYAAARAIYLRERNARGLAWLEHDLGLLALARDDLAEAERVLREALGAFEAMDYPWAVASTARALGSALLRRGERDDHSGCDDRGEAGDLDRGGGRDEACAQLRRALDLHDRVGDRRGVAETIEALAEVAIIDAQLRRAARLLGAASWLRDKFAAPPSGIERVRLVAAEAGLRRALGAFAADHERQAGRRMSYPAVLALAERVAVPRAATSPAAALTPRQVEVAGLVASGQTNRQIGRQLGLSEKTIEVHVHNIMRRLHVPNRASVATWLAQRENPPAP